MSELTYEDFKQRINIQEVLQDAGYRLNRKDGIRYPSYVRLDSNGRRIRGDKFIVTRNGLCCFQPPEQRNYNIISFIKEHPHFFAEYTPGMSKDRLVNLVCNRLLNQPMTERNTRVLDPEKHNSPFNASDYEWQSFDRGNWESQKKFYPYFKNRGINLATQRLFADSFFLTTKQRTDGKRYTNLSFLLVLPGKPDEKVGLEERSRPNQEGKMVYKGMAAGSNATQGIWIGNPGHLALPEVRNVYWFESALDAMAFCQLNASKLNMEDSVFVSTGGSPSQQQFKGMIAETSTATHHLCFDRDRAGQVFAINFALTANTLEEATMEKRLEIINGVIQDDYDGKVTLDMLNGREIVNLPLHPEVLEDLNRQLLTGQQQAERTTNGISVEAEQGLREGLPRGGVVMDGNDLSVIRPDKGWYREGRHGREVTVDDIRVEPSGQEGKYKMTAIIDGERVSHEITQKQYDKFMAIDDYHRLKLFSKVFGEVDMKSRDRTSLGVKIGAALLAGVTVAAELEHDHHCHSRPVVFAEHHHHGPAPRPYFKPGVDTPMDVAARNFEAAVNEHIRHEMRHGM